MNRVILVAEIGINHNGDVNLAKKLIDVAHIAGCDYVKFQKRTIDVVYPQEVLDKYRESPWGTTNREQKYGLEFGQSEYDQIDEYCRKKRIGWFASPWDVESVEFLRQYRPMYMKVASACLTDSELLDKMTNTNAELILSTGMSTKEELNQALTQVLSKPGDRARHILACTSTYPTRDDEMNLNFIKRLQLEYSTYDIGFSNHSPGIQYSIVAAALGAKMIEFHITLDRAMYGSDQAASIETGGVMALCKHVRNLEKAMGTGEWTVFESEEGVKKSLRRF
jgi:N-acetylneuraminate synthase